MLQRSEFGLAAGHAALFLCDGDALACSCAGEVGFEFGHGGEDGEEHLAGRIARVVDRSAVDEAGALRVELGDDGVEVGDLASESIEFGDHEGVPLPHGVECFA